MSQYCPLLKRNVVYLECLECDNKVCKEEYEDINSNITQTKKEEEKD